MTLTNWDGLFGRFLGGFFRCSTAISQIEDRRAVSLSKKPGGFGGGAGRQRNRRRGIRDELIGSLTDDQGFARVFLDNGPSHPQQTQRRNIGFRKALQGIFRPLAPFLFRRGRQSYVLKAGNPDDPGDSFATFIEDRLDNSLDPKPAIQRGGNENVVGSEDVCQKRNRAVFSHQPDRGIKLTL